jgi:RHS repeat-associated protein
VSSAALVVSTLLATLQVPTGILGDGYAGSRVRGLAGLLGAAPGLEDRASPGMLWPLPFTYGETASDPSSQYNGRVFDPGTGFHDYGARMYWPQIGRFISADSVMGEPGSPMTLNRYSYVLNNPYKFTDPSGHAPMDGASTDRMARAGMEIGRACANGSGSCAPVIAAGVVMAGAAAAGAALAVAPEAAAMLAPAAPGAVDAVQQAGRAAPSFSRALTAADLGVQGTLTKLDGTFSLADKVASVRIDMIEGKIGNPLQIVDNLRRLAASNGADTLNISGTLANPRLLEVLTKRYDAVSQGANEVISIALTGAGK